MYSEAWGKGMSKPPAAQWMCVTRDKGIGGSGVTISLVT